METPPSQESAVNDAAKLLLQAKQLMLELSTFSDHYHSVAETFSAEAAHVTAAALNYLKQQFKSEIQGLEGVVDRCQSQDTIALHSISSTNLPFFEALWDFAKRSQDVVALRKWVCEGQYQGKDLLAPGTHIVHMHGDSIPSKNAPILVDIISDGGETWIKVSSTTSKRLLWDMTKLGWAVGGDDDESEDFDEEDFEDIPLYKLAKGVSTSARAYRIRNSCPEVHLVLPRIASGESKDIDLVLDRIRSLGVKVLCSNHFPPEPSPALCPSILSRMAPSPLDSFSKTLNVDASVLIALISDFAHASVEEQPWFTSTQRGHLASEGKRKITTWIYPAMGSHNLICTAEAAETCRSIVGTIGTKSEIDRMNLLLGKEPDMAPEALLREFRRLSDHDVPDFLRLPVRVVENRAGPADLPAEAWEALQEVTEPSRSVFAFGWATNQTTLTSNGIGLNSLTQKLEELPYAGQWPSMWLCPASRSLVGVPKHIREAEAAAIVTS
ncbi:hypothetical protein BX600DRAFT_134180 [Xylariales sp. PMI_506]|nr:hypothetical protein BX600DRAFT_134180 [Xylariales sp. PMI_506]